MPTALPTLPSRPTRPVAAALAALLLGGCLDVERESGVEVRDSRLRVASGTIDPQDGARIAPDPDSPHAGVLLEVPPGAVDEPVDVTITARYGDPALPSAVQQFEIAPAELELSLPALLTVEYAEVYRATVGQLWADDGIVVWRGATTDPARDAELLAGRGRDLVARTLTVATERFGSFYAMHPQLRILTLQEPQLIDPAAAGPATLAGGMLIAAPGGTVDVAVGQGSLEDFRRSGPDANLVVVHGTLGSGVALASPSSLAPAMREAGFNPEFRNVVVFEYPSGRAVAAMGNRLYDALRAEAGAPGFGCRMVAHGSGGIVARYALERAHADPSRPGYEQGDPPLTDIVDRLVLIGAPNAGADLGRSPFAELVELAAATDARFVQGLLDLQPGTPLLADLNGHGSAPHTTYFAIAGDVGGALSDGFVDVRSVLDLPAAPAHQIFTGPLYDHLGLFAFADRTGIVQQAGDWLSDRPRNAAPIVGSVGNPTPLGDDVYALPFALTDDDTQSNLVVVQLSVGGAAFVPATSADGAVQPLVLDGTPAPGSEHVFRWDAAADVPAASRNGQMLMRLTPFDFTGAGVPGQTGRFRLRPGNR